MDGNKNPPPFKIMKILLTGASGLLGNAYAEAAIRRSHEVIALSHSTLPSAIGIARTERMCGTELDRITSLCFEIWPDVIVNCAALSSSEEIEKNPGLAEKINVDLPRHLAQISAHMGIRFLHISTDKVFDGQNETPYRSTDMPTPNCLYGQTKLKAEREVLEHHPEDPIVLRIPLLMGKSPGGKRSVHETLFTAIDRGERPRLSCHEIRQPSSAGNVAEVLLELSESRNLHGIFHWAGTEALSRFEMGQRILKHFNRPDSIEPIDEDDTNTATTGSGQWRFDLHPILNKLKTRPVNFDQALKELTDREPLRQHH